MTGAVDRFMEAMCAHPQTAVLGAALRPYRALAGKSEAELEQLLDLLADMWNKAKGGGR